MCSQGKGIVDQSYFSIVMMMMMMMKTMLKMMKTLSIMIQDQKIRSGINPFNKNLNCEIFAKKINSKLPTNFFREVRIFFWYFLLQVSGQISETLIFFIFNGCSWFTTQSHLGQIDWTYKLSVNINIHFRLPSTLNEAGFSWISYNLIP